jgi:twinkle protein
MTGPESDAGITYADLGIDVSRCRGAECKTWCPQCRDSHSPGNQNNRDLSVNLQRGEGRCHRCDYRFGLGKAARELKAQNGALPPKTTNTPTPPPNAPQRAENRGQERSPAPLPPGLHPWALEWFVRERGITGPTVSAFGIRSDENWQGKMGPTIHFPYRVDGRHVNTKHRFGEPPRYKEFRQDPGTARTLFNVDTAMGAGTVVIVEGELDVMAAWEAGWKSVVSAPDGAPGRIVDPVTGEVRAIAEVGSKGAAFDHPSSVALFEQAKRIVIATDNDDEGRKLGDWLVEKYGALRCFRVQWPENVKDLNDALRQGGPEMVRNLIEKAKAVDLPGIYSLGRAREKVRHIWTHGYDRGVSLGWPTFDHLWRPKHGLMVMLGIPGNGKTSFLTNSLVNLAHLHDWRHAIFSPEMGAEEVMLMKLTECAVDKPLRPDMDGRMTEAEMDAGIDWVDERFFRIDAPELGDTGFATLTLEQVVERAEMLVIREGIKTLTIDPWNRMQALRPEGMTATEYVAYAGNMLSRFAYRHEVLVGIVVHPIKPSLRGEDEKMPSPYDAADSANWYNMADVFLGVHRNKWTDNVTTVKVWKHREEGISGDLGEATFTYDWRSRRFYCDGFTIPDRTGSNPYPEMPVGFRAPAVVAGTVWEDEGF